MTIGMTRAALEEAEMWKAKAAELERRLLEKEEKTTTTGSVETQRVQDRGERLHDHQNTERGGKPDGKAAKHDQALHSREKPGAGQEKQTTTP